MTSTTSEGGQGFDKPSPNGEGVGASLHRLITMHGPMSVAEYMGQANAHYYASRDPLGADGDFTTAPEISQMFGELVGLCLADAWHRAGRPPAHYVELGPGRGTLAADALRAMRSAGLEPSVHFVETSQALRTKQAQRIPDARWHHSSDTLPDDAALLIVANEFFDALPVRQLVRAEDGWRERLVGYGDNGFAPVPGPRVPNAIIPDRLHGVPLGTIVETSPASAAIMRDMATQLVRQGGMMLTIDYGHDGGTGDTLQAVSRHAYASPWEAPGERDLTAHVDFAAMREAALANGARVLGPVGQGAWLGALGLGARAAALVRAAPARAEEIEAARLRLTAADQMGTLFKVQAAVAPGWPDPAGFAP